MALRKRCNRCKKLVHSGVELVSDTQSERYALCGSCLLVAFSEVFNLLPVNARKTWIQDFFASNG